MTMVLDVVVRADSTPVTDAWASFVGPVAQAGVADATGTIGVDLPAGVYRAVIQAGDVHYERTISVPASGTYYLNQL